MVDGRVVNAEISSLLHGELLAIRTACGMVKALGIYGVLIESNNQMAFKVKCF
ncbi:hypothetical protein RHMOL_Rhmol04G0271600 [Rhododendron molle]|uniref:Uncharacterized protein n=1 Tax=Rhododendron molle TaxID=49168 RepID=A0ACC0P6J0_RHOML|nr:hypothetical protein RHMOL_Rhmol04G0271600 [Rhododendron molle]